MKRIALVICLASLSPILWAAGIPTGTWLRRANKALVLRCSWKRRALAKNLLSKSESATAEQAR